MARPDSRSSISNSDDGEHFEDFQDPDNSSTMESPVIEQVAPLVVAAPFEGKAKLRKRKAEQEKKDKASAAAALTAGGGENKDKAEVSTEVSDETDSPTTITPTPTSPTDPVSPLPSVTSISTPAETVSSKSATAPKHDHSAQSDSNENPWGENSLGMSTNSNGNTSVSDYSPRNSNPTNGDTAEEDVTEQVDSLTPLNLASHSNSNSRPFSLQSQPETPSTYQHSHGTSLASRSHSSSSSLPHDGEQSIAGIWRSSELNSNGPGMMDINLEGDGAEMVQDQGEEEGIETAKKTRRKTVMPTSVPGQSYDFLLQRLEAQNSQLETDPKAKRASVQGNTKIRASFERVQRELAVEDAAIDWDFWGRVMSNYEDVASTQPRELSRAIQKGIPPALRGMTWQLMAASKDQELENTYAQLLKETSSHEKSISRDLGRTFPKLSYFQESRSTGGVGQENLFNVVKAYSLYDPDVGYTQGLQFIVGPLLLNMPDEEAFCVLVRLMKSYDLRSHYTNDMPGLQLRLFQFDRLLEELLPGVFMHLLRQGVKSSMYASQWFLTLFGYRFPLELVCSVFDLVFAEGVEAIFRFSVAILKRNEKIICELEFEHLLEFLKNGLFEAYAPDRTDEDDEPLYKANEFVREALQIKITPLMLDQFGEEWENLLNQQNAHTLEIENLRKANSQLSNQVRSLESSLSQINIEHCDLVKQVVMSKLEREELEDELIKYKIMFADLVHAQEAGGANSFRLSQSRGAENGGIL